jgi:hypothetical protein
VLCQQRDFHLLHVRRDRIQTTDTNGQLYQISCRLAKLTCTLPREWVLRDPRGDVPWHPTHTHAHKKVKIRLRIRSAATERGTTDADARILRETGTCRSVTWMACSWNRADRHFTVKPTIFPPMEPFRKSLDPTKSSLWLRRSHREFLAVTEAASIEGQGPFCKPLECRFAKHPVSQSKPWVPPPKCPGKPFLAWKFCR